MKSKTLALIGTESRRSFALFAAVWVIILSINEVGFRFAAKSQAHVADLAFDGLLRREELVGAPYRLGQAISDLEQLGLIQCTNANWTTHPERSAFLNTQQKSLCTKEGTSWLTPTLSVHRDIITGNNEVMNAEYQVPLGPGFALGLWGSRILWTFLILMFWRAVRARFKHQQEIVALESAHAEAMMTVATQVSHDITAPVAALDGLLQEADYVQIPSTIRTTLHWEIVRIRDIATDLLTRFKQQANAESVKVSETEARAPELLAHLIEGSLSEKRLAIRGRANIELDFQCEPDGYFLFASVNAPKLHRILSNLLNNAIEALPPQGGSVTVTLARKVEAIEILVIDTGKGIPAERLTELGKRGVTIDKKGGNGFGFHDAKVTWKSWGGDLSITSQVGQGTRVQLLIQRTPAPIWFLEYAYLRPGQRVVILDDDPLIHDTWNIRLTKLLLAENSIEVLYFKSGRSFQDWHRDNASNERFTTYFFDYELSGEAETGLDLATKLKLGPQTSIITGRYELKSLQEQCAQIGARLLPKTSLAYLPVSVIVPNSQKPEAILIDDDIGNQIRWLRSARRSGKRLQVFSNADQFFQIGWTFRRDTALYVDVDLGNGVSGVSISKIMSDAGFKEIYLTTAHSADRFDLQSMSWIRAITDKNPPWSTS